MSKRHEYTIDEFWDSLRETSPENLIKDLYDDPDFLDALLLFLSTNKDKLVERFEQESGKDESFEILKRLICLYPLSSEIIKELVVDVDILNNGQNLTDWYDVSEVMIKSFRKFQSMFASDKGKKDNLTQVVESLERTREQLTNSIAAEKQLQMQNSRLHDEVTALKQEYEKLKEELSEESLNSKKQDLGKEIKKLKDVQIVVQQELEKMHADLERVKVKNNPKFEKALTSLGDILASIKDDEEDE